MMTPSFRAFVEGFEDAVSSEIPRASDLKLANSLDELAGFEAAILRLREKITAEQERRTR